MRNKNMTYTTDRIRDEVTVKSHYQAQEKR